MAKILVGGPEGGRKDAHDDLVARLRQEHHVTYIKNDGQEMYWQLAKTPLVPLLERYNLLLYDTDLIYPSATVEKKLECFEIGEPAYLSKLGAPVIILAEPEIAVKLRPLSEKAGFIQIDQPYQIEQVVHKINEVLEKTMLVSEDIPEDPEETYGENIKALLDQTIA